MPPTSTMPRCSLTTSTATAGRTGSWSPLSTTPRSPAFTSSRRTSISPRRRRQSRATSSAACRCRRAMRSFRCRPRSGHPRRHPGVRRSAHGDGYAVHVWTIDDEPTMKYLFDLGVDGIMSAQPMRLEKTMCNMDVSRPPLPDELTGQALHEEVVDRLRRPGERALHRRRRRRWHQAPRRLRQPLRGHRRTRDQGGQAPGEGPVQLRMAASARRTRPSSDRDRFDAEAPEGGPERQADPRGRPAL